MAEYIILGAYIAILAIFSERLRKPLLPALFLFIFLTSFFLVGCRYYIGADWYGYKLLYENGYATFTITGKVEFGYMFLNKIIKTIGFSSGMFFGLSSFASFLILYKAAKIFGILNLSFAFLVYYCMFLPSLQFNIVRTGLLGSCFILGVAYRSIGKNKWSLFWLFLGASMHYSGVIFLFLIYFLDKKIQRKWIYIGIILAFSIHLLGTGRLINKYLAFAFVLDPRISGYLQNEEDIYGFSIGMIFNIVFFVYMYLSNKEKYEKNRQIRTLINLLFISVITSIALSDIGIFVARLGQIFNLSLIFLWPICIRDLTTRKSKLTFLIVLFLMYYLPSYFLKGVGYNDVDSETRQCPYEFKVEQLYINNVR